MTGHTLFAYLVKDPVAADTRRESALSCLGLVPMEIPSRLSKSHCLLAVISLKSQGPAAILWQDFQKARTGVGAHCSARQ